MTESTLLKKYPELREFIQLMKYELYKTQRPANEVILDDEDVMKLLKISKRKLQYLKSDEAISYSSLGVRSYYLLSDVLKIIYSNRIETQDHLRIK